jgi:hypothetical protein
MKQTPFATKTWKSGIAALGALAGLALAPAPAHAQPCADVPKIANDLLSLYLDQFESNFTLSVQKNCDSLQKTFLSACSAAVKNATKCWSGQLGALSKAAGPVCSEAGKPEQCNATFKNNIRLEQNAIDSEASAETADCQTKAVQLFSDCLLP